MIRLLFKEMLSSTETPMPNGDPNFWFSLAGAIGSLATAAAFGMIIYQTRLTKKQISQTQEEIDNTLRPWIGISETTGKEIGFDRTYVESAKEYALKAKINVNYSFKNFGRVPARITRKRYKWSKNEISKNELYSEMIPVEWSSSRSQYFIFPDQDVPSSADSNEQSFLVSPGETFYFGLLAEYDSGEGTRTRDYGIILRCMKDTAPCLTIMEWTK